jgi:hypothetical protein
MAKESNKDILSTEKSGIKNDVQAQNQQSEKQDLHMILTADTINSQRKELEIFLSKYRNNHSELTEEFDRLRKIFFIDKNMTVADALILLPSYKST